MPEGIWAVAFVALWALLLAESVMIVVLGRHLRHLQEERVPDSSDVGPALGAPVPAIDVTDLDGRTYALGGAAAAKRLLLFLSLGCTGCRMAIRDVEQVPSDAGEILLLWNTNPEKLRALADEYQLSLPLVADERGALWEQFNVTGVPFAIVIDEAGRVMGKSFAHSAEHLQALLSASSLPGETQEPRVASPSPAGPVVAMGR